MGALVPMKPEADGAPGRNAAVLNADVLYAPLRPLIAAGRPHHVSVPSVARPVDEEVEARIAQADLPIGAIDHHASVRVPLPVIGPETDWAGRAPGPVATAWTLSGGLLSHAGKPPTATSQEAPRWRSPIVPIGDSDAVVGGRPDSAGRRCGR